MDKIQMHKRDIRDIFYFIDHVNNEDALCSIIEELGYKIGVNIRTDNCKKKIYLLVKDKNLEFNLVMLHPRFLWLIAQ